MGGHAVRFYGLARNTNDFNLNIASDQWDDLAERLSRTPLFGGRSPTEGPSWRPDAFRRFNMRTLPDGHDEWLEFWRANHLLAPHAELLARAERGQYGTLEIAFLGIQDLIRSKETERDADWQDVGFLEGVLDARLLAKVERGELDLAPSSPNSEAGPGSAITSGTAHSRTASVITLDSPISL